MHTCNTEFFSVYLTHSRFVWLFAAAKSCTSFLPTSTNAALDSKAKFECVEVLLQETNFKTDPIQNPAQFIPPHCILSVGS
jgi:hypothetical protein